MWDQRGQKTHLGGQKTHLLVFGGLIADAWMLVTRVMQL